MDWNDIQHFLALARTGSARAAGAELGVSHSTIVRRVDALEERLSARLFDRHRDGYGLTDAGRQMLPRAERIEREMDALERHIAGRDARFAGSVSITCCDAYVADLVLGALDGLCAEHPLIELNISADGRLFDLSRREADIAIRAVRAGSRPPAHLIGRKLAPLVLASFVAREHADRISPDRGGPDARWIGLDEAGLMAGFVAESAYPELPVWGRFGSLAVMHRVARRGLGVTLLPTYVGDPDPALRRLDRPDLRHVADIWLVSHPDLRDNARLRATRAALHRAFDAHGPLFSGERCADAPLGPENAPRATADPQVG